MIATLDRPSLGAVRAGLIQNKLSSPDSDSATLPAVVATGKTGSGKSTLGNLLLGIDGILRSSGRQDCTDAVHIVRFPRGLRYIDLPGVASDDKLENYNRVALGLAQNPSWPTVGELRILGYDWRELTSERAYPVGSLPQDAVAPNLILYLIAPQHQFTKDEQPYLRDLLSEYGAQRVVYVLNLFHSPTGEQIATAGNLADVRSKLAAQHSATGFDFDPARVVSVDCKTGAGLADLLATITDALGPDQGQPLVDVIAYQARQAPLVFRDQLMAAIIRYSAGIAAGVPVSGEQGLAELLAAAEPLTRLAGRVVGRQLELTETAKKTLRQLAESAINELRNEATQPIVKERSKKIYEDVPIYGEVTEDDRNRPIFERRYRTRKIAPRDVVEFFQAIGGALNGEGFGVDEGTYDDVFVGYEQRVRSVVTGYTKEHVRTERWSQVVGTRTIAITYDAYGVGGVAWLLTAWSCAAMVATGTKHNVADVTRVYDHARAVVAEQRTARPADLSRKLISRGGSIFPPEVDRCLGRLAEAAVEKQP